MSEDTLVSIVVISYNSEDYILEALESVKSQSYINLELIISDDGSTDGTVLLAESWIKKYKGLFQDCRLITAEKNSGISINCNRGLRSARGQYVKLIAADDLLLPNCIRDLLNFCLTTKSEICFSRVFPFCSDDSGFDSVQVNRHEQLSYDNFFRKNEEAQFAALLRLAVPLSLVIGCFYSMRLLREVGFYDEEYKMMEDYPFLLSVSKRGYRFKLLECYTCKYRVRSQMSAELHRKTKRHNMHYLNLRSYRNKVVIKEMYRKKMYLSILYLKILILLLELEHNRNSRFVSILVNAGKNIKQLVLRRV